jgi:hypothetical protein
MKIDLEEPVERLIDAVHELNHRGSHEAAFRPHMGASTIGETCERKLWLSFRWAVRPTFPGRVLRLFRRGHREEETVVADLRAIGCKIRSTGAEQSRVTFGSHVSGSIDGIITSGVPGAEKSPHVLEIKTAARKAWEQLHHEGVEKAQPKHFVQMQAYMHGTAIERALYVSVCKDDDRLHVERVRYDRTVAEKHLNRAKRIATQDEAPWPISADPSWFACKWCDAHDLCHGSKLTKEVNCRTCAHSTAREDGTWTCERHDGNVIPEDWQRGAHECHVLHYDLVPWNVLTTEDGDAVFGVDGVNVRNGSGGVHSTELVANPAACRDASVQELRKRFGARVVG